MAADTWYAPDWLARLVFYLYLFVVLGSGCVAAYCSTEAWHGWAIYAGVVALVLMPLAEFECVPKKMEAPDGR